VESWRIMRELIAAFLQNQISWDKLRILEGLAVNN
jgi:hypothetical protein